MKSIHIITGQTASGKTARARELARVIRGEIVNCDSRQAYVGLDIISGKDIEKQSVYHEINVINGFRVGYYQSAVHDSAPIWLYDCAHPDKLITAYDFRLLAQSALSSIWGRGKTPIIVGGSYFYLASLLYQIDTYKVPADPLLRDELENTPLEVLQKKLRQLNESVWQHMNESDRQNPRRLIRKIEIVTATPQVDITHHDLYSDMPYTSFFDGVKIHFEGVQHTSRELLTQSITRRVRERIAAGAVDEYRGLIKQGYSLHDPGLSAIGCKEIALFCGKEITEEQLISLWSLHELQYAKRQMTFMNRDSHIIWSDV